MAEPKPKGAVHPHMEGSVPRSWKVLAIVQGLTIAVLAVLLVRGSDPGPPNAAGPMHDAIPADPVAETRGSVEVADRVNAAPEQSREPRRERVEADAPTTGWTLIHGRVTSRRGEPVEAASLYVRREGERSGMSAAYTPGRGYAIAGLDPGRWTVTCRADGFAPFSHELEVLAVAHQVFDVVLDRAQVVRVAFVDENGRPAFEVWGEQKLHVGWRVSAIATVDEPPDRFPMTTLGTISDVGVGRWRARMHGQELPERFAGVMEIEGPGPTWVAAVLRQHVIGKVLAPSDVEELDLVIPTDALRSRLATVRARLVASETGAPIEGARLSVSDRQSGNAGQPCDANGDVVVENAIPGIVEIGIQGRDREQYHQFLRLEPGADVDLGVIRVDPTRRVEGMVRGPDGSPLAGVGFTWFRVERYAEDVPLDHGMSTRSDSAGKFQLRGVGVGRYLVRARHDSGVADLVIDTAQGDVADAEIHLVPSADVTIVNRVPKTTTYLVRVCDSTGAPVAAWLERPHGVANRPLQVPRGRYRVEIREDTRLVRSYELDARQPGAQLVVP